MIVCRRFKVLLLFNSLAFSFQVNALAEKVAAGEAALGPLNAFVVSSLTSLAFRADAVDWWAL
jgi:hypothetical protein